MRGAQWALAGQDLKGGDSCLIVRHILYECEWIVGKRSEPRIRVHPLSEKKDDCLCNLKAVQMSEKNAEVCDDIEKEAALAGFPRAGMMHSRFRGLCKGHHEMRHEMGIGWGERDTLAEIVGIRVERIPGKPRMQITGNLLIHI